MFLQFHTPLWLRISSQFQGSSKWCLITFVAKFLAVLYAFIAAAFSKKLSTSHGDASKPLFKTNEKSSGSFSSFGITGGFSNNGFWFLISSRNRGSGGVSESQKYSPARHKSGIEYGSGSENKLLVVSIGSISTSVSSLTLNRRTDVGERRL
ncbi:hypothetical protein Bca4012_062017 [Brassica carinata]